VDPHRGSRGNDPVRADAHGHPTNDPLGYLALVLHCHMPYVEGFGTWPFGEEWLWEAVARVYLPLLRTLRGRPVTLVVTPVLGDQLEALSGAAGDRFLAFLRQIRAPLHERAAATCAVLGDARSAAEIERAAEDYARAEVEFLRLEGDLVGAFAGLGHSGVELWTSAASHAILPLLGTPGGLDLQVSEGIRAHKRRFGSWNGGFWLPECGYEPGLERGLAAHGVSTFCIDPASLERRAPLDDLEPVAAADDLAAIPLDRDVNHLVWNDRRSYPNAPAYRDYHRATDEAMHLWRNDRQPYDRLAAIRQTRRDAAHFAARVAAKLDRYRVERGRPGLVCVAMDAEVLGHWWYEGQAWLSQVFSELGARGVGLRPLSGAAARSASVARTLVASSWGAGHDLSSWDAPDVAPLRRTARWAERALMKAMERPPGSWTGQRQSALQRAARELLALQASDWPYLITRASAGAYPDERFAGHAGAFVEALQAAIGLMPAPEPAMRNLAPFLDIGSLTGCRALASEPSASRMFRLAEFSAR
jgi:1,4-alpha-glucan branching enzyme